MGAGRQPGLEAGCSLRTAPHSRLRPQLGEEELPEVTRLRQRDPGTARPSITSRRSLTLLTGERECARERKEEAMGTGVRRAGRACQPGTGHPVWPSPAVQDLPAI